MTQHILHTLSNSTATRLTPIGTHSGRDVTIQNVDGSAYVYIGGNDSVTSSNYGFRLAPNFAISFELPGKDGLFAISSIDGAKAAVIITGLEQGS